MTIPEACKHIPVLGALYWWQEADRRNKARSEAFWGPSLEDYRQKAIEELQAERMFSIHTLLACAIAWVMVLLLT